jgi:VanZ family protein
VREFVRLFAPPSLPPQRTRNDRARNYDARVERTPSPRLVGIIAAVLLVAIAFATLMPAGWQIRLGLHWLLEHFLAYFTLTAVSCIAWPRPMTVAAIVLPLAVLLEAAQALTPDRTPDPATALAAATGVAVAALIADLVISLRKKARRDGGPGPRP